MVDQSEVFFFECMRGNLRVARLQQVPTRNFLIRIINLPASHLTTSPASFKTWRAEGSRVPHPPVGNATPSLGQKSPQPSRHHQASAAAWPTSWCFVVAAKKERLCSLGLFPHFSHFTNFFAKLPSLAFPVGKCVFGSAVCNLPALHWHIIYADCI